MDARTSYFVDFFSVVSSVYSFFAAIEVTADIASPQVFLVGHCKVLVATCFEVRKIMAELKTRKRHEAELRRIIQRLTKMHARELAVYLATAKSLDDIPEEFWTRVQFDIAEDDDDKAALLGLIFTLSAEQHAESIAQNYPLLAGVGGLAAITISNAAATAVRKRLQKISKPYVVWSKQLVRDAIKEIEKQGGPTPSRIDEAVKKVFGPYRANRMADTEANLVMIGGGEFAVNKSKIAVVRFWAHSKLRPPRHSNAEKKPCPICSPREGKAEADWGGKAPGHCHPGCDCLVLYVDEYGNIIGDDANESDTFDRFKDRLPKGFLKPREQMYRDHPELLESRDPAKPRKFSSTQIDLPSALAEKVIQWGEQFVPDDCLADDGREDVPHVTTLFGLHTNNPLIVENAVRGFGEFELRFGLVSRFECPEYDVLKLDVQSDGVRRLNARLSESCENTQTHPTYIPHCTIAYVKKGSCRNLDGSEFMLDMGFHAVSLLFSGKDRTKKEIPLTWFRAVESFDSSKHPRGHEGNPGQFSKGGGGGGGSGNEKGGSASRVESHLDQAITDGITIRAQKYADVSDMDFEADEPTANVKTKIRLSDNTDLVCYLNVAIVDGKAKVVAVDSDEISHSKELMKQLSAAGFDDADSSNMLDRDQVNAALERHSEKLLTPDVVSSLRMGLEKEIKQRSRDVRDGLTEKHEPSASLRKFMGSGTNEEKPKAASASVQ
jgi:2'-5' RNA ligase